MAWQDIGADETDADSPLNQTLMDKIRGNLDALHDGGGVTSAGLKAGLQEVSTNSTTGVNLELASAGEFAFFPRIKSGSSPGWASANLPVQVLTGGNYKTMVWLQSYASAVTVFASVRYVQASRDEPVVWLERVRETGEVISSVFDPEGSGDAPPFINMEEDREAVAIELRRSDALRRHLFNNINDYGVLWQVHLGMLTGEIKPGRAASPMMGADRAPALHHRSAKVVDFTYKKGGKP